MDQNNKPRSMFHRGVAVLQSGLGRVGTFLSFMRRKAFSSDFKELHYTYFILTCSVFSGIFYGISTPPRSVAYIDSLFIVVSAMTLT